MNKVTYLKELESLLKTNNVEDIDEILAEYSVHFDRKLADGYAEEEIAAKLGSPKEIALQFNGAGSRGDNRKTNKLIAGIGLFFADIVVIPFFVAMYAWLFAFGAMSLSSALCGICLILRPLLPTDVVVLPPMPYPGGAILGASVIALGVLIAAAAVYSFRLIRQMGKSYRRWHKNVMSDGKYPPYSMHPVLKDQLRRRLRSICLIALIAFVITFILGFIVLSVSAGSMGFWHVWHWFA